QFLPFGRDATIHLPIRVSGTPNPCANSFILRRHGSFLGCVGHLARIWQRFFQVLPLFGSCVTVVDSPVFFGLHVGRICTILSLKTVTLVLSSICLNASRLIHALWAAGPVFEGCALPCRLSSTLLQTA